MKKLYLPTVGMTALLAASITIASERSKSWDLIDMQQQPATVQVVTGEISAERVRIDRNNTVQLTGTYERLKSDPEYIDLQEKTDAQGELLSELNDRLDTLREKNRHWEPAPDLTTVSGWHAVGPPISTGTPWEPEIDNQTEDFVQTQPVTQRQARETKEFERLTYDISGGTETRVSRKYHDYRQVSGNQTRLINIVMNGWANTGSLHNCSQWSPNPATVSAGEVFTQAQVCTQSQIQAVEYLSNGALIIQKGRSRDLMASQERPLVGTKQ